MHSKIGSDRFHDFGIAADHDRQGGVLGADIAAGNRGIEAVHAFRLGRGVDFLGQRRFAGGHVDEDAARLAAGEGAFFAEEDFAHVLGEADDGEDDVAGLGDLLRGGGPFRALFQERLHVGLVLRAIIDGRCIALGEGVLAHPASHDAGADPADACFSRFRFRDGHKSFPLDTSPKRKRGISLVLACASGWYGLRISFDDCYFPSRRGIDKAATVISRRARQSLSRLPGQVSS